MTSWQLQLSIASSAKGMSSLGERVLRGVLEACLDLLLQDWH
eukprot:CAMPEP_0171231224 /NCGR_PEP_ID=MMETSP0790-20130122/39794_1 /TAXON_ID=2925 /ORGANISM="Alexandrium catenella, Strain OF101" /LENGTH=41 /DNA_ID= /DNA_START= /DNA_END= /DNA_ORIENTATION=